MSEFNCSKFLPNKLTSQETVKNHIRDAIKRFEDTDSSLIEFQASERTITARLARYIEDEFNTKKIRWNVDCDYNRISNVKVTKKLPSSYLRENIRLFKEQFDEEGTAFGEYLKRNFSKAHFNAAKKLLPKENNIQMDWGQRKIIVPDILVHERGCFFEINHNLLAVEIKTSWFSEPSKRLIDLARVKTFASDKPSGSPFPTYQYGAYIYFSKRKNFEAGWLFKKSDDEITNLLPDTL